MSSTFIKQMLSVRFTEHLTILLEDLHDAAQIDGQPQIAEELNSSLRDTRQLLADRFDDDLVLVSQREARSLVSALSAAQEGLELGEEITQQLCEARYILAVLAAGKPIA